MATLVETNGIKRFSDARIQAAIDSALAELGPNEPIAVVAHHIYNSDGTNRTQLSAAIRLGNDWSIMAAGYKDWTKGDLGAEAKVVWKPKLGFLG